MKSAYDIFISYRRKDAQGSDKGVHIARTIKQYLEIKGYKGRVFFDYSELSNEDFDKRILSVIRQAKVFISVLTPDSMLRCVNDGDWVRRELLEAYNNKLQMIFINPDGREIAFPGGFPQELSFVKTRNHLTVHMDSSFERDMDDLIEKHIAPVSAPSDGSNSGKYAKVRVRTDHDCIIKRFDEEIGSAKVGEYSIVYLPKGKHRITFISSILSKATVEVTHEVTDLEYEGLMDVKLESVYRDIVEEEEKKRRRERAKALLKRSWIWIGVVALVAVVVGVVIWGVDDKSVEEKVGSMVIGSKPSGASVKIDGKDYGVTPLTLNDMLIGSYSVVISKKGYESQTKTILIKEGETVEENVVLVASKSQSTSVAASGSKSGTINGYEYVDLGLPSGLKWATCNVGADSPEEYGDYYAWGEILTKSEYTESNSQTRGKSMSDISGDSIYDVARAKRGSSWRLPTQKEFEELENNCKWQWTTQNGKKGYKVTGPNGNSIFLPAAGYRFGSSLYGAGDGGVYWSSTPYKSVDSGAYGLYFNSSGLLVSWDDRDYGQSVRPVSE